MGFTTLKDVLPGAFAATILECLYPRGLNALAAPQREGISLLQAGCPVIDRMMPPLVPGRPTSKQTGECYTHPKMVPPECPFPPPPIPERHLASHPRLRCLLYGNKVLKEIGRMENNLTGNSMVFGTTSLMYEQVLPGGPKRKDISEEELAANLDPQASSSDQVTTQILMQTKDDVLPRHGTGRGNTGITLYWRCPSTPPSSRLAQRAG